LSAAKSDPIKKVYHYNPIKYLTKDQEKIIKIHCAEPIKQIELEHVENFIHNHKHSKVLYICRTKHRAHICQLIINPPEQPGKKPLYDMPYCIYHETILCNITIDNPFKEDYYKFTKADITPPIIFTDVFSKKDQLKLI